MADKLTFSLVSPEREVFAGEVDQVDIPGSEGDLGVFPNHSALMVSIRTGAITVYSEKIQTHYFIQGGFADVTPDGLTILAEKALLVSELAKADITASIESIQASLVGLEGEAAFSAQQNLEGLTALMAEL